MLTGNAWREGIIRSPQQNYAVTPEQPWLDGYAVDAGTIRQFVAMPLGRGYTVEEQRTGSAEWGGLQIRAVPLRKDVWLRERKARGHVLADDGMVSECRVAAPMGLAPGGRIRQEIYGDRRSFTDWDRDRSARVFVHL